MRDYGNAISHGPISPEANPPYSLALKHIVYEEDAQAIMAILREYGIITPENEALMEQGLEHGALLIPQVGEFVATSLAHRLRGLHLDIVCGLSEDIHLPKNYRQEARGNVSKKNLYQNVRKHSSLKETLPWEEVTLATTPTLEGHTIQAYVGIITECSEVEESDLEALSSDGVSFEGPGIYRDLGRGLKAQASKLKAHAVVGINYQFIPTLREGTAVYRILCVGSAVRLCGDGRP